MPRSHEKSYYKDSSSSRNKHHERYKKRDTREMPSSTEKAVKGGNDIIRRQQIEQKRNNDAKLNRLVIEPNMIGHDENDENPSFYLTDEQRASRAQLSSVELQDLHYRDRDALTTAQNVQRVKYYEQEPRERNERGPSWHEIINTPGDSVLDDDPNPYSNIPREAGLEVMNNDHAVMWEQLNDWHFDERDAVLRREQVARMSDPAYLFNRRQEEIQAQVNALHGTYAPTSEHWR